MDQGQMVKQLFDGKPGERRRTGRHRLRWLDDVEAALRTMGIKKMEAHSKRQKRIGQHHKEAKALQGL
jgi:hypothetical protein